jgi:hypothetical protein
VAAEIENVLDNYVFNLIELFIINNKRFSALSNQIAATKQILTGISGPLTKNVQRKFERVLFKIQIRYRL